MDPPPPAFWRVRRSIVPHHTEVLARDVGDEGPRVAVRAQPRDAYQGRPFTSCLPQTSPFEAFKRSTLKTPWEARDYAR